MTRLVHVEIEEAGLSAPPPEIEQERRVALFDLIEENVFALPARDGEAAPAGPFRLVLAVREGRLSFDLSDEQGEALREFQLSLGPFRQVVKDYFQICDSYSEAVKTLPPAQIETIDMARRGIHMEGARIVQERLKGKAEIDEATARRLFTLVCVLQGG